MYLKRVSVTVETIADGSAEEYSEVVTGRLLSCEYVKAAAASYTDGVDLDVTLERTGQGVWDKDNVNASVMVRPRAAVQDLVGADATTDGTRLLREPLYLYNDRIKIVLANGGDTKTGTFHFVLG